MNSYEAQEYLHLSAFELLYAIEYEQLPATRLPDGDYLIAQKLIDRWRKERTAARIAHLERTIQEINHWRDYWRMPIVEDCPSSAVLTHLKGLRR